MKNPVPMITVVSRDGFNLAGLSWDEIRDIPIEELGPDMTFGKSFESLRKTWYSYKKIRKMDFQHQI